jgi:hypothetical protein
VGGWEEGFQVRPFEGEGTVRMIVVFWLITAWDGNLDM